MFVIFKTMCYICYIKFNQNRKEMRTIEKTLIEQAEKLSADWNNTGFIVLNVDGSLSPSVWNHWKWEEPKREIVATVNHEGWKFEEGYCK